MRTPTKIIIALVAGVIVLMAAAMGGLFWFSAKQTIYAYAITYEVSGGGEADVTYRGSREAGTTPIGHTSHKSGAGDLQLETSLPAGRTATVTATPSDTGVLHCRIVLDRRLGRSATTLAEATASGPGQPVTCEHQLPNGVRQNQ
ncbi:hypothetical protein D5S17_30310 [Pseudonocardiaceae bacterium YIM PH 21723]|nr:hypothetical protein D5S17_30310 [Pseudonocardiaceae bacterium YIM PH 21723]